MPLSSTTLKLNATCTQRLTVEKPRITYACHSQNCVWPNKVHFQNWAAGTPYEAFLYAMTVLLCSVRIRAYAISTSKPTQLRTANAVLSANCV